MIWDAQKCEAMTSALMQQLQHSVYPKEKMNLTATYALSRVEKTVYEAVDLVVQLAEPWLSNSLTEKVIMHSAAIHVYARILDDALDEALPINRLLLLRGQAWYWEQIYALGGLYPALQHETTALIQETILAVEKEEQYLTDNRRISLDFFIWAEKNHHLLLAPLLLSNNNKTYQKMRQTLRFFLVLLQAREELAQRQLDRSAFPALLHFLMNHFEKNTALLQLAEMGWPCLASRIIPVYQTILMRLKSNF